MTNIFLGSFSQNPLKTLQFWPETSDSPKHLMHPTPPPGLIMEKFPFMLVINFIKHLRFLENLGILENWTESQIPLKVIQSLVFLLTSYVTPPSVPASHGMRSVTSRCTQPQSLVHRSSPDSPTFQSGLGPSMVRKDIKWRFRSTENSADGAARLVKQVRQRVCSCGWIKCRSTDLLTLSIYILTVVVTVIYFSILNRNCDVLTKSADKMRRFCLQNELIIHFHSEGVTMLEVRVWDSFHY